jgi:hypothetical protein
LREKERIRLRPESSVLGLAPGDRIDLRLEDAGRLAEAYLMAIERTYAGDPTT